jgi:hypothetical protein
MSTVIHVLLIDDDKDYYESFKNRAAKYRIILKYAENLQDAIGLIRENKRIAGVIIDGKGFIKQNQEKGTEREDFVHEAILQIKLLETKEDRDIPHVVLTSWYDQLKDALERRVKLFDKKKVNENELSEYEFFNYLKDRIIKTSSYKIYNKYDNVFNIVKNNVFNFSTDSLENKMLSLLTTIELQNPVKSDFNILRDVFENILISLKNIKIIPSILFYSTGKPDQAKCLYYIQGRDVYEDKSKQFLICAARNKNISQFEIPDHIIYCFDFVKKLTNDLSHIEKDKWTYHLFNSCVNSIIEILLWIEWKHLSKNNNE